MKNSIERMEELLEAFRSSLCEYQRSFQEVAVPLTDFFRQLSSETRDPRFHRQANRLKEMQDHFKAFQERATAQSLGMREELSKNVTSEAAALLGRFLPELLDVSPLALGNVCHRLLNGLGQALGADRGLVLFYFPGSGEAQVVAALNFDSPNLSLEEHTLSRTILRDIVQTGRSLLLQDAVSDDRYGREASITRLDLKSVLGIPLKESGRVIGAVYLENRVRPFAFDQSGMEFVEKAVAFAVRYLAHTQLLPLGFTKGSFSYLDSARVVTSMVGKSQKMTELCNLVRQVADSPATVLIEGESGTGKEMVAQALHYLSSRRDAPLVAINCAAIPDHLLESYLFGHEKGSFTSATQRHIGFIEQARKGTVFLDEINELELGLQGKLLRFLESGEFYRVGGEKSIQADVRIIAASSRRLADLVRSERFHAGLYYRLNLIQLTVPPLRERRDDIPLLVDHFLRKYSEMYGREVVPEPGLLAYLQAYSFPGNVRQLEHTIHRLVLLSNEGKLLISNLPAEILQLGPTKLTLSNDTTEQAVQPVQTLEQLRARRGHFRKILAKAEFDLYKRAIEDAGGNVSKAADRLGIGRVLFYKALRAAARKAGESAESLLPGRSKARGD